MQTGFREGIRGRVGRVFALPRTGRALLLERKRYGSFGPFPFFSILHSQSDRALLALAARTLGCGQPPSSGLRCDSHIATVVISIQSKLSTLEFGLRSVPYADRERRFTSARC